ncbi:hypothetical protein [Nostoc sp. FACHB-888]|uniref:hypothetical protein n=1 Tax=Nostoc sp. FACHB-888 TaxID=2692842 RepID=UPI00168280EE|nr:hypothetical protein [Nostoc sp. FACHB-888]MBD2245119.1 hypothetical protein [Nostoc sp. FACHB-888]
MKATTTATTATKTYIPVRESVLKKILKAMEALGVIWDGSINHIDRFCWASDTAMTDWCSLNPAKNHKKVVYIQYVA